MRSSDSCASWASRADHLVDVRQRLLDESDDAEVRGARRQVGVVDRGHEERGQAGRPVAQPAHRLEAVDAGQLRGDEREVEAGALAASVSSLARARPRRLT